MNSELLNRVLRAEAELATAMDLLSDSDLKCFDLQEQVLSMHESIDRAHLMLDSSRLIPPRDISHKGLAVRINLALNRARKIPQ